MLEKLTIRNIALIESAEIEFDGGLNVLSGETGAGKSVILDSIDFVLGAKADKNMIRYGCDECFVRAEFRIGNAPAVREALNELDIEGDELLVISRKFHGDGKSAIKINGCSVTASMLRKVTVHLVDVHGQSEHFYLLKEVNQLRLLDELAAVEGLKQALCELLDERKELLSKLALLGGNEGERSRRLDMLRFQIDELSQAGLRIGEDGELLELRNQIAYSGKILSGLQAAESALTSDGAAADAVGSAQRALSSLSKYGSSYAELSDRLKDMYAELSDIAQTVGELAGALDIDEREADRIETRLDELSRLKKKYGGSVEAAIRFLQDAQNEYELLSDSGEQIERLNVLLEALDRKLYAQCEALTHARKAYAEQFSARVSEELKSLNIRSARFEVEFEEYSPDDVGKANADGLDKIRFLFSANAGEPLKPLSKIISGGEMSRFMLAVKTQLSAVNGIGTYIFDEIDAGISGRTAKVVGEKFTSIAEKTQIIAVSHLAQIASRADAQFLIEKKQEGDKTFTTIRPIDGEERKREIARLIGGDDQSEFALLHAEELLGQAKKR